MCKKCVALFGFGDELGRKRAVTHERGLAGCERGVDNICLALVSKMKEKSDIDNMVCAAYLKICNQKLG